MKELIYKGIAFDDYEENEDGAYWAEICEECTKKHWDIVKDDIDEGGAIGCCSVKGCCNSGENRDKLHYYIDFKPEFVEITE